MSEYEAVIYKGFKQLSPKDWDCFVDQSPQGSLFCKSWWLQAVCPIELEILVLYKKDRIVAGLPMVRKKKFGFKKICTPCLTHTLGVLLESPTSHKYTVKLSKEMKILKEFVKAIPTFDYFFMNFNYNFNNWLPFFWAGYSQTTYYSYVISDLWDTKKIWENFSSTVRKEIRKTEKDGLKVNESDDIEECLRLHKLAYGRQSLVSPHPESSVRKLDEACRQENARKIFIAQDSLKKNHAMYYVVYDSKSAHALLAGADPALRNSGAQYLVCWAAIQSLSSLSKQFDFSGGCITTNIESHIRKFGGTLTPHYMITKNNMSSPKKALIGLYRTARNTWNKIKSHS